MLVYVSIFIPQSKSFITCVIYSDVPNQEEALTFLWWHLWRQQGYWWTLWCTSDSMCKMHRAHKTTLTPCIK